MKKVLFYVSALALLVAALAPAQTLAAQNFAVSQSSFTFYYVQGVGLPTSQEATFTNQTDTSISYNIQVPNQPKWLDEKFNTDSLMADPGTPNGLGAAVNPTGLAPGVYTTAIFITGSFADSPLVFPITLSVSAPGNQLPANIVHPEGTNIKTVDDTVYRIINGSRQPYTSAGAFLSYGYNSWATVEIADAADMALPIPTCSQSGSSVSGPCYIPPRDGSLINDHGTIYIISNGYRQGFASAQVFLALGYSFGDALNGDTSFLSTLSPINSAEIPHPSGTVVNAQGTICVIESPFQTGAGPARKCFSTLSDMNSWGVKNNEILPANSYDQQLNIAGIISARTANSPLNP